MRLLSRVSGWLAVFRALRSNVAQDAILSLRDRRWIRPPVLNAIARKPSSFNSHAPPWGSFSVRSRSMGSMKRALTFWSGIQEPVCDNRHLKPLGMSERAGLLLNGNSRDFD